MYGAEDENTFKFLIQWGSREQLLTLKLHSKG